MALLVHLKAIFNEMKGAYGWPRIWRELSTRGIHTGKERVRKLMKVHGLRARGKRKFKATTKALMAFPSHRTFWNAGLPSRRQTGFGLATSPICGHRKDGSISRSSSTCSAVRWSGSR